MEEKALTYEEFIALAEQNYKNGGEVAVECWDKKDFDRYVENCGIITRKKAMEMFADWKDEQQEQYNMMFGEWF